MKGGGPGRKVAVVVLLGPGDREVGRTIDLIDSIRRYEPDRVPECDLYIVNDGEADAGVLGEAARGFPACVWLDNPLAGTSRPPFDRMTAGVLHALSRAIAASPPYAYVLKLDTDALVINSFHDRLVELFASDAGIGVAGSYLRFPDGSARPGNARWAPAVRRAARLRVSWEEVRRGGGPLAQIARAARRGRMVRGARRNGYLDGHHVLGGSYAISGSVLPRWKALGLDRLVRAFEGTGLSEDVVVSMLAMRAGFRLVDYNEPGQLFGVWHRALGAPPAALAERYSIVHSLKSGEGQDEAELRRIFRGRREGVPAGESSR